MSSNNKNKLFQNEVELSQNSLTVLKKRYLRPKENGEIESPKDLFIRVAKNIAEAEVKFNCRYFL